MSVSYYEMSVHWRISRWKTLLTVSVYVQCNHDNCIYYSHVVTYVKMMHSYVMLNAIWTRRIAVNRVWPPWTTCQIRKIQNCGLRMRRECRKRFPRHRFQRKPLVYDPGMHVTHVPWCISGSLIRDGGGKRSRHSRRMRNPKFCVSGKRFKSVRSTVIDLCVCSLAPMRRGCHPELDNFKLIYKIYILRISERSFPHVNAIRPCLWLVRNGPDTGLMSSDTKPLPEPMLTQFYFAAWLHPATMS